jgi:1,4-dihydroxy-2-naphthoyl-CoA synthase
MTSFVLYEQNQNVVTLTLNRPQERNAIGSHEACDEIAQAAERINGDPTVHAVILTGPVRRSVPEATSKRCWTGPGLRAAPILRQPAKTIAAVCNAWRVHCGV